MQARSCSQAKGMLIVVGLPVRCVVVGEEGGVGTRVYGVKVE